MAPGGREVPPGPPPPGPAGTALFPPPALAPPVAESAPSSQGVTAHAQFSRDVCPLEERRPGPPRVHAACSPPPRPPHSPQLDLKTRPGAPQGQAFRRSWRSAPRVTRGEPTGPTSPFQRLLPTGLWRDPPPRPEGTITATRTSPSVGGLGRGPWSRPHGCVPALY